MHDRARLRLRGPRADAAAHRPLPRRRGVPVRDRGRDRADPRGRRPRDRGSGRDHPQDPGDLLRDHPRRGREVRATGWSTRTMADDDAPRAPRRVEIYDTTLRDGSQLEGISLTVDDKLRIAEQLDWLGVDFIEAGWPGANPKDDEVVPSRARPSSQLDDQHARRVRVDASPEGKGRLRRHAAASRRGRDVDRVHRREDLGLPRDRGARDDARRGRRDGRRLGRVPARPRISRSSSTPSTSSTATSANPEFALRVLEAAAERGATRLVLCDTNGGSLPHEVEQMVREVVEYFASGGHDGVGVAVHLHDDAGTGVANALAGVRGGAVQVQGTINGYGERTGNCNLTTIIPNLTLKMGIETIPADRLDRLTPVAHHVAELVNMALNPQAPYVGRLGVRAQGGPARERDREAIRRVRARLARRRRERHALRRVRARGAVDDRAEGQGARARSRRAAGRTRSSTCSSGWSTRATTSRSPTRRSSCSCAGRRDGSSRGSRSSPSASSPTTSSRPRTWVTRHATV